METGSFFIGQRIQLRSDILSLIGETYGVHGVVTKVVPRSVDNKFHLHVCIGTRLTIVVLPEDIEWAEAPCKQRPLREIVDEISRCALSLDNKACIIGNVTAQELLEVCNALLSGKG